MNPTLPSLVLSLAALLGGCASDGSLEGERTVFNNPYTAPLIDQTGIGPQCDVNFGSDATCLDAVVAYDRRGRSARLSNGETVRLTRAQVRLLRERAELIAALSKPISSELHAELPPEPPPAPQAPPPAARAAEAP